MIDFVRMRQLIRQEERMRWAIEKQMSKATKRTASISGMSGGISGDKVGDNAVILAEMRTDYDDIQAELESARAELRNEIKHRDDPLKRTVIKGRYVSGFSVRRMAAALNYSEQHIFGMLRKTERLINQHQQAAKE